MEGRFRGGSHWLAGNGQPAGPEARRALTRGAGHHPDLHAAGFAGRWSPDVVPPARGERRAEGE